ncbi:ankyrin repeat-containing domain protein [Mycena capillaripes]|nr:ankyrin repeat-containing domain protein [Mycena capillaripes]
MPLRLEDELLQAVAENRRTDVENLLARGADPNAGLFGDHTALSIAVHNGNDDILDLILHGGPIACMREQHESDQRAPPALARVWKTMRLIGVNWFAKMSFATYGVRRLAVIVFPPGSLRTACLYGSYYLWFIQQHSIVSAVSSGKLRQRWLTPLTYCTALVDMALSHQIVGFFIRRVLPAPTLPVPAPSLVRDVAVAIPLCFFVDATITAGLTLLKKAGFHRLWVRQRTSGQERWTGEIHLADPVWRSPAEKTLQSILDSDSVTEAIVLKLLRKGLLASPPYKRSEVARNLLDVAINKCWANLTEYLLEEGVLVDHWPSSSAMKWPAKAEAIQHTFPHADLDVLPAQIFKGRHITNQYKWFHWNKPKSISTFAQLARSTKFRELASSEVNDGHIKADDSWAHCHRMMNVLRDGGANPLLVDKSGCDALSDLVKFSCSRSVFQKMVNLWKEAQLHSASTEGNVQATSPALYNAVDTTKPDLEVLRILLEAGLSPNWEFKGLTPFHAAASMNGSTDVLNLLYQFGAEVNNCGRDGSRPILCTWNYEAFLFFLNHGVDPNDTGRDGKTILQAVLELTHSAVFKDRLVQCLIERGAVVYDAGTQSSPAFLTAVRRWNPINWSEKILDLLLEQIPVEERQEQLDAAVQVASRKSMGRWSGNQFPVFYLLRKGANPALVRAGRNTLLHLLCDDDEFQEDIAALLGRGILDVNVKGEGGESPLHHAVRNRSRHFVFLLLAHGADPNLQDTKGLTPLQHLTRRQPEEYTIAQTALDLAGDADGARYHGVRGQAASGFVALGQKNAIKQSLEEEEIFQALADHGADLWAVDGWGRTPLMTACEVGNTVLVGNILYRVGGWGQGLHSRYALGAADGAGKTALHLAAANGSLAILKALFQPRRVFCREMNEWRALAAVWNTHDRRNQQGTADDDVRLTVGDAAQRQDRRDHLYLPNVSVSKWPDERWDSYYDSNFVPAEKLVDMDGRTPLHLAAEGGRLEAVKYMLAFSGLKADVRDKEGRTAADLALENSFYDIYSVLLDGIES